MLVFSVLAIPARDEHWNPRPGAPETRRGFSFGFRTASAPKACSQQRDDLLRRPSGGGMTLESQNTVRFQTLSHLSHYSALM